MSYSLAFSQAIVAAVYIADKVQQGMFEFIPTKQLAEDLNLARPSAVKILQNLNRAGIIETREGAKGGVRLAQPAADVSILDIFLAIEQERPLFQTRVNLRVTGAKPTRVQQAIIDVMTNSEEAMKASLQQKTIADLVSELYE